ncbi:Crp/Fnr family transcriptional regulator [Desulfovibrio ferrophilus]|uniref:Cyclic nucleotide-binding protein n=1 Tax=Desulfovibrio ferrophilus TaxID=241368 RepID=A0A2Z6B0Y1_9BACT|nr:cyclic nucleotide-binding domain-containing protein [Desulfovibrio ferrophilus]BBD09090.1 cyclic nucleotide-binding protein [Desulfovibrio ferrophilus]
MASPKSSFLVRNFLKYSVIFGEGSKGDSAYLLKEGRVEISKMMDGKKKVFAILKPVSMFGEMAILLGDEKRTATAVALEDSKVVEIKNDDFQEYIRQSPPMISTLLNVLVHRLKTATSKSLRVPNIFVGICNVFTLFGKHGNRNLNYLDSLNYLSSSFNTNKETIDKVLETLEQEKMIEFRMNDQREKTIYLIEIEDFAAKAAEKRKGL